MIYKLITLANRLDKIGAYAEANLIDNIINHAAADVELELEKEPKEHDDSGQGTMEKIQQVQGLARSIEYDLHDAAPCSQRRDALEKIIQLLGILEAIKPQGALNE